MKTTRTRISSETYRGWALAEWCAHVETLGVASLTAWANSARSSYNHAVSLGVQRRVARELGWLPKLEKGEMHRMTDLEFAERFRDKGTQSVTDMWKSAQHWCEFLRRENRLDEVAGILGFGYVQESHPSDIDYYLERCSRVGDLKAWRYIDRNAADAARRHGLMKEITRLAPRAPKAGYPSAGGPCRSLPELAVARLLEANDIAFTTQLEYPFTFPRGRTHHSRSDFYLLEKGAFVEVWSVPDDETDPHWEQYQLRRQFKQKTCQRLNLRLLEIEAHLLFRSGIESYVSHVAAVLEGIGLPLRVKLGAAEALDPKPIEDRLGGG